MQYSEMVECSLMLGADFNINEKIAIHMPTVEEIIKYGESSYYRIVYSFASTSSDYKAQLFDDGLKWEDVSDYDMFVRLFLSLRKKDLSILFPGIDMSKFELARDNTTGELIFHNVVEDIIISRVVYELISDYICKMHGIEKIHEKASDEPTRLAMIDEARQNQTLKSEEHHESYLRGLVCSMANTPEFKADYFGALKYPISIFMDCVKQVQRIKHFNFTMQGVYAGTVDIKKVPKSSLAWLKKAE